MWLLQSIKNWPNYHLTIFLPRKMFNELKKKSDDAKYNMDTASASAQAKKEFRKFSTKSK